MVERQRGPPRDQQATLPANSGAAPPSAKATNPQASERAAYCASQKTPDGTAVRTVTVAPSWTSVPGRWLGAEHQPLRLAGARRPEHHVVALVLEQLLCLVCR